MDRKSLYILLGLSGAILLLGAIAFGGYCPGRGSYYGWNMGYGMMGGGMWGLWLLLLVLIVVGGVLLLSGGKEKSSSLRILDERLARGEITKEQYEELKKMLG